MHTLSIKVFTTKLKSTLKKETSIPLVGILKAEKDTNWLSISDGRMAQQDLQKVKNLQPAFSG